MVFGADQSPTGSGVVERGSDAWNIAQGYTALKILKTLIDMDKLVKIAVYGCENVEQSLEINQNQDVKTFMRIDAIKRLIDSFREIFENTEFAMHRKMTAEKLTNLQERTQAVENVISGIARESSDMRTNTTTIVINEEHFTNCLNELRDIKKEIPKPLNENALIFPSSDEIDLDKIKREIVEGG